LGLDGTKTDNLDLNCIPARSAGFEVKNKEEK
jgi:hypothetical protein